MQLRLFVNGADILLLVLINLCHYIAIGHTVGIYTVTNHEYSTVLLPIAFSPS